MTFRYEAGDYRFDIGRYIVYEDTSNYFKEVEPFRVYGVANDKLKEVEQALVFSRNKGTEKILQLGTG